VKILFQTYASAKGEKVPPILDASISVRLEDDPETKRDIVYMIDFVWFLEQIFYFVMMTYYIA